MSATEPYFSELSVLALSDAALTEINEGLTFWASGEAVLAMLRERGHILAEAEIASQIESFRRSDEAFAWRRWVPFSGL